MSKLRKRKKPSIKNRKFKTKSSAKKRFEFTGTGKIRRRKAFHSHILEHKSAKQGRRLRTSVIVDSANEKAVRKVLGK